MPQVVRALCAVPDPFMPPPDFDPAIEAFLDWRAAAAATRKTYASVLSLFSRWSRSHGRSPQFVELARRYVNHLVGLGKKAATVSTHAAVLRQFSAYLVRTRQLPQGEAIQDGDLVVPKPEKIVYQRSALTRRAAKKLTQLPEDPELAGLRQKAIIALMLRAALRSCEIVRARLQDIQLHEEVPVLWVRGKGRPAPDAFVVLNQKTQAALAAYLVARGPLRPQDPLIAALADQHAPIGERQVQRLVNAALEEAELKSPRVSPHSLRHTAASLAVGAGASLSAVQAMMRHADPRTTARYVHLRSRLTKPAEDTLDF